MAAFTIEVQFSAAVTAAILSMAQSQASMALSLKVSPYSTPLGDIAASLAVGETALSDISTTVAGLAKAIETPPPPPPLSIRLALPTITKEGKVMPNFELANDEVATIPILVDDAAGDPVAPPAGDVFSVTSSSASLGAAISADGKSVVLTPMVQQSPGLTVVVSDSAGLSSFTQIVDIVADTTAKAITLDLANATEVSQPVPTAPGP